MCRLFGFRSVIPSQVHTSLLQADNALGLQSRQHPDGWGVAHYIDNAPHLIRSSATAISDNLFHRVSGVVASETVVAHVRKATQGVKSVLNCHPFQYRRWVFAHNGDISNFDEVRDELIALIDPHLRRFILGDTDSEVIFHLFLSEMSRHGPLGRQLGIDAVMNAMDDTVRQIREVADRPGLERTALLTLLATNGTALVAMHGGKELYWSTYKQRCADRDTCSYFAPECEAPSQSGFVNHLILSSEPLSGENIWHALQPGEMIGVDARMQLVRRHSDALQGEAIQINEPIQ